MKDPVPFENLQMLQNLTTSPDTVKQHDQDFIDCKGDDSSCISKDDALRFGGVDHKNVTSSAASVNSPFADVCEKFVSRQSITDGSPVDQTSVEEGDQHATISNKYSSKAVLPTLGSADGVKSNLPFTGTQIPHLQSQDIMDGNGSDELVDVRVCDICGDVGREALLVLCSQCNDGAEHIYCMTPTMDKVPEDDWLCEECLLTQDLKRQCLAAVKRLDNAPKPSCLRVQHVGKMKKNHFSDASFLSDERLGLTMEMRSEIKKIFFDGRIKSLKCSVSGMKTQFSRASSLKILGENTARQVSSFVDLPAEKAMKQKCSSAHRSSKSKQGLCGGSANASGSIMGVRCSQEDIRQSRRSTDASSDCELTNHHSDKKLHKRKAKHYLMWKNKSQMGSSLFGSSPSRFNSTKTKSVSRKVKATHSSRKNVNIKKSYQLNGNTNVKTLVPQSHEGKDCSNTIIVRPIEERKSPCQSSDINVTGNPEQTVNLTTQKADFDNVPEDNNDHSVASHKIMPFDSQRVEVMPTPELANDDYMVTAMISVVPDPACIWKGIFKLEKSGKLPFECCGVEAHLSTCASSRVIGLVHKFSTELLLKEVPRLQTWPIQFQNYHPTEQDIALYFFAQDLSSYGTSYRMLLEDVTNNDSALEANFGDFQLLVFPSSLLPLRSQRWNSLPFFWGVFRTRKADDSYSPSLSTMTVNEAFSSPGSCGSESKFVSAPRTFHNFIQVSEVVDPMVLQSAVLVKCGDRGYEREVASPEKHTPKRKQVRSHTIPFVHDCRNEVLDCGLFGDNSQKEKIFDKDIKNINKTDGEGITAIDFFSDVNYKGQNCTRVYESASGFRQTCDVASVSFSLDSGPSGSSDGGYAKSAKEEPLENSGYYNAINLDLYLGNRSEEAVDLNLSLGLPNISRYNPKESFKNGSSRDGNVSLVLSLGLPSWNS
ncbi:uncharacterized protein LOC130801268 isoform X3 [Amaranthus tricolor]|nr:uncharacterized protein LOC130801268 isoform X3 [Amaranthus tricolor]XP_057521058.1 uncharacterized protein LOC130801268 isoform X3 [Amaranthus tricolor]